VIPAAQSFNVHARAENMVAAISGMGQPATTYTALYAHPIQAFAKIKHLATIHQ